MLTQISKKSTTTRLRQSQLVSSKVLTELYLHMDRLLQAKLIRWRVKQAKESPTIQVLFLEWSSKCSRLFRKPTPTSSFVSKYPQCSFTWKNLKIYQTQEKLISTFDLTRKKEYLQKTLRKIISPRWKRSTNLYKWPERPDQLPPLT